MSRSYSSGATVSFGFDRTGVPVVEAVSRVARRLWPVKTARQLAARAGATHRAAEFWLAHEKGLSADALAELLRSDAGLQMLEAIIGEHKPSWWPSFRAEAKASAIAERLESIRAEIDEAKRGLV